MIKVENGIVEITGTGASMCMELSIVISHIRKAIEAETGKEFADKKIAEAIEDSKLDNDEIIKKYTDGLELSIIREIIMKLFGNEGN